MNREEYQWLHLVSQLVIIVVLALSLLTQCIHLAGIEREVDGINDSIYHMKEMHK